jgi:hypothetical protein
MAAAAMWAMARSGVAPRFPALSGSVAVLLLYLERGEAGNAADVTAKQGLALA